MPETNFTRKAVSGAAIVIVMSLLASGLGYVIRIILAKNLSPSDFGLVYAVVSFFGMIYIFQHMGLNDALIWCVAKHKVKDRWIHIKSAAYFVLSFELAVGIVIAIIVALSAGWLSSHYFKDPSAYTLLLIQCALFVLLPFEIVCQSIFQGLHRMALMSGVNLARILVAIIGTSCFLWAGFGARSLFLAYLISATLPFLLWIPMLLRIKPGFLKIKTAITKPIAREMFSFGLPIIFTSLAGIVMTFTDTLVLTAYRNLEEVGMYNAATPTVALLWVIPTSLMIVTFPLTTELWESKKHEHLRAGIEYLYKYAIILIIPFALSLYLYPEFILSLLFGPKYVPAAIVLKVLSFGSILYMIGKVNDAVFCGIGKPRISSKIALVAAIVNLAGNILLIPRYGMIGAACSTLAGFLVMLLLGVYNIRREIQFSIPVKSWIGTAVCAVLFALSVRYLSSILNYQPIIEAGICLVCGIIVYLAGLFCLRVLRKRS